MSSGNLIEKILFPTKSISENRLAERIKEKTILITGASFGIGEELSKILSNYSCQLILVARTEEKLKLLQSNLENVRCSIAIFAGDLRDEDTMRKFGSFLEGYKVDIFVSNAGISIRRSLRDSLDRMHDFDRTMNINYRVPVQIALNLIPNLEKVNGQIINVSAINVLLPAMPNWSAYQSSKSAFDQWCRSNAPELKSYSIGISTAYLPLVRTRMIKPTKTYDNTPAMDPKQAAIVIANLIATRKKMFKPWWLRITEFFAFILRKPVNSIVYKKSTTR